MGRIWRRFAAALETQGARRLPGNRVALRIGDGDHGVVERGVHVRDARGDVLELAATNALRFACHYRKPCKQLGDASRGANSPPDWLLYLDRNRVEKGKIVSVRVSLGCPRIQKTKKKPKQ